MRLMVLISLVADPSVRSGISHDSDCISTETMLRLMYDLCFFFFNDTATTEIYTRSIVGSVRCVQETGYQRRVHGIKMTNDARLLTDASWTLYYITLHSEKCTSKVVKLGLVPRIVELLAHTDSRISLPNLRILGGITTGSDEQTQKVLDSKGIEGLAPLLKSKYKSLRKESCWVLSNIAAGTPSQINSLFNSRIIPDILQLMQVEELDVRKEAAWIINNLCSKAELAGIQYMIESGVVKALCEILNTTDVQSIAVCLQSLSHLLRKAPDIGIHDLPQIIELEGYLEIIEKLQYHSNQVIYKLSLDILEKYSALDTMEEAPCSRESLSIFNFQHHFEKKKKKKKKKKHTQKLLQKKHTHSQQNT
eukprot:TRINITY_DN57848_c0_g1_i2.p1 TRINITY_DN57848_c0_g1~~TRINITY_DN57848_c0_g1_i2.p1  ORF type:complete len:364 (+),score=56.01 TRINITY_DN57848_c0_g1_i2:3-1094(+)